MVVNTLLPASSRLTSLTAFIPFLALLTCSALHLVWLETPLTSARENERVANNSTYLKQVLAFNS